PQARRDIREKTQKFVDRAEFERHAEPMSDAHNRISTIIRAAGSLRSALDGGDHDADVYARTLIKKHLRKSTLIKKHLRKKGDAIKKRRRKKDNPLRNISSCSLRLMFASQDALRELNDTKDEGFKKGDAWKRWSNELTDIAKALDLPWRVRKDSDKRLDLRWRVRKDSDKRSQSRSSSFSPFVEFVWALQKF